MPQQDHEEAAKHHELAANHHRNAAFAISQGRHDQAAVFAQAAQAHAEKAAQHSMDAASVRAKKAGTMTTEDTAHPLRNHLVGLSGKMLEIIRQTRMVSMSHRSKIRLTDRTPLGHDRSHTLAGTVNIWPRSSSITRPSRSMYNVPSKT
jgi:hypothetical protein